MTLTGGGPSEAVDEAPEPINRWCHERASRSSAPMARPDSRHGLVILSIAETAGGGTTGEAHDEEREEE
jgi:hypothetical protein